METCGTCKFWKILKGDIGHCHRYPPAVHVHLLPAGPANKIMGPNQQGMALKPVNTVTLVQTKKNNYCGEWHGRE